ncbi:hypothetical protein JQK87_00940 [Streptomyces sp. G44]|uniref:hypothetical protein n=1 Tax=Streptomyces sp. G44 TaxID=2807632 RepID=UPI0019616664|nr:hypothetical protein [Streptomyces sp. G44]MBM7167012.1 hypothetical protein [Streptomyces sp. G44]
MRALLAVLASVALASAALTGEAAAEAPVRPAPAPRAVSGMDNPCHPFPFEPAKEGEAYWYYDQDGGWCAYADVQVPRDEDERWDNWGDCWDRCG